MAAKATILCVEDEGLLLEDIREELEDAGYDVLTAPDGKVAIERIGEKKPDLILCDVMMPDMDGPAFLTYIRSAMPALNDVPLIFLTARGMREDIVAGKQMGADDYLTKPVDYDLLLATVEAHLRQVSRVEGLNRIRLQQIYEEVKRLRGSKEPLTISIVTGNPKVIAPIRGALLELGCKVRTVPEANLENGGALFEDDSITILTYSDVVNRYLTGQTGKTGAGASRRVLLAPPSMSETRKESLMEAGLDDFIDYPYKPVDIFKVVMNRLQEVRLPGAKAAG